jgi:hypothetical protein
MAWVVGDAECQPNDGGNPPTGLQLATEASGFGAALQSGQLGELLDREPKSGPRHWPMSESIYPAIPGT